MNQAVQKSQPDLAPLLSEASLPKPEESFPIKTLKRIESIIRLRKLEPYPLYMGERESDRSWRNSAQSGLVKNILKLLGRAVTDQQIDGNDIPIEVGNEMFSALSNSPALQALRRYNSGREVTSYDQFCVLLNQFTITYSADSLKDFRSLCLSNAMEYPKIKAADFSALYSLATCSFSDEISERHRMLLQACDCLKTLSEWANQKLPTLMKIERITKIKNLHEVFSLGNWIVNFLNDCTIEAPLSKEITLHAVAPKWMPHPLSTKASKHECHIYAKVNGLLSCSLGNDALRLIASLGMLISYCSSMSQAQEKFRAAETLCPKGGNVPEYDPLCSSAELLNIGNDCKTIETKSLKFAWENLWNELLIRTTNVPFLHKDHGLPSRLLEPLIKAGYLSSSNYFRNNHLYTAYTVPGFKGLAWDLNEIKEDRRRWQNFLVQYKIGSEDITSIQNCIENSGIRPFGSFRLGGDCPPIAILTGANARGKSSFLSAIRHLVHANQTGRRVLAKNAELSIVDKIYGDGNDKESLLDGISRIQAQVAAVVDFLNYGTPKSLGLFDELYHGTSGPYQLALAWATLEEISKRGLHAIISTHLGAMTLYGKESGLSRLKGCFSADIVGISSELQSCNSASNYSLNPGFQVKEGAILDSDALRAAKEQGMHPDLLTRAENLLQYFTSRPN